MLRGLCDLAPLREIVLIFSQLLPPALGPACASMFPAAGFGNSTFERESSHHNDLTHICFGNSRPQPLPRGHPCAGAGGVLPLTAEMLLTRAFGKSLRLDPKRRDGLGPGKTP